MAVTGAWWSGSATVAGAIAGGVMSLFPGSFPQAFAAESEPAVVDPGFTDSIAPLLAARCLGCHAADEEISGGLRLDLRDGWAQGGDSGPAIVPGEPEQSLLVRAIRWEAGAPQMPPDGKLAPEEIELVEAWVRRGAHDPRGGSVDPRPRLLPGQAQGMTAAEGRRFWSVAPLADPTPPDVADPTWNRTPIDRFIRARLDAAGVRPQAEAAPEVLVRRITEDLIGLPPTPEESDAFVAQHARDADGAVADLVDHLLAGPAFGERFGRHWLDLARFAESSGGGRTLLFKDAWRYRDWVIAAVNADLPYDRFVVPQLAGDLLAAEATDPAAVGADLVASGFLALGPTNYEEQEKAQLRFDIIDEQLETIGRTFLGLSIGCCRCHDHPSDPLSQADYYGLAGIFASTRTLFNETDNVARWIARPLPEPAEIASRRAVIDARVALLTGERTKVKKEIADSPSGAATATPATARWVEIEAELGRLGGELPPRPMAMVVEDHTTPGDTAIRVRGVEKNRGRVVPRGLPEVFATHLAIPAGSSGRMELAAWIGSAESALPRRVIVNRVWAWLLGRGIVPTVDNFGASGEPPSHPELLDWLARRFAEQGSRLKPLVREIVLSRTYRQAVAPPSEPDRGLWSGALRRRLDAEQIRDSLLVAAGRLDRTIGGLSIVGAGEIDANDTAAQTIEYGYVFDDVRRSVYTPAFRNRRPVLFEAFDFADINASSGGRQASTVAVQALFLANDPFVVEACRAIAARVCAEAVRDDERLDRAFRLLVGRQPSAGERSAAVDYLVRAGSEPEAWAVLCQSIVSSPDFRFRD
jgi:Protein of unknown function (DUF1553)/Protein of unknown function (DUF1549)/Planctomycete cytochrome C